MREFSNWRDHYFFMKNIPQAYRPSYLWFWPLLILGGSVISAGTIYDLRRVKVPGIGPLWNLWLSTGEERRIPFIFDDFHFCHSRVIGLDMMENRIFTQCRMVTWVVFLRMFWNFFSSLLVKRGGSLSFLTIFTFAVPELLDWIWRKIGFLPYVVW